MRKKKPEVTYNKDGTVNLTLRFYNLKPRRGKGFRSVNYHDAVLKSGNINVYVKVWSRMPRARIRKVMVEYAKNRMIQNSPIII
jgi:hypothetical protein